MKNLVSALFLMTLLSCGGSSELVKNPPFEIEKTTQKTSVNKTQRIQFVVKSIPEEVSFEYVYFQNKKSEVRWEDTNLYYATFSTVPANSKDRVLSVDLKEEAQNPLPQIPAETPFKIQKNEALLEYKVRDKTFYTVLEVK